MIWEAFKSTEGEKAGMDITRGWLLFTLAVATSLDALAVGLSLAFLESRILLAALIIGVVAFVMSNLGFYIGRKVGGILGQRAKLIGGLMLIGIGLHEEVKSLIFSLISSLRTTLSIIYSGSFIRPISSQALISFPFLDISSTCSPSNIRENICAIFPGNHNLHSVEF